MAAHIFLKGEAMKRKIFLMIGILTALCAVNVQAKEIEYTTSVKGNNVEITGTAEPGASLNFDVPEVYNDTVLADDKGDFYLKFKLPLSEDEYEYTFKSLDINSYFVNEFEDFKYNKTSHYTKNTATRDLTVGNSVPSLLFSKENASRFVWKYSESITDGFWGVSADFNVKEGNTTVLRVTNSIGNSEECNSEINHLKNNISFEAFRVEMRSGKLRLYYVDNTTNQTERKTVDFADCSYNEWHRIQARMNIDTLELQLYLDNKRVLADEKIYMAAQQNYTRIYDTTDATADWNLDNIKIEKNITSKKLMCESAKTAFDAVKRCKREDLKEILTIYRDYFDMQSVSNNFWNDDVLDRLYSEIQDIHNLSELNKKIAICDVLSDIDNIDGSIQKYPNLFGSYGIFTSIASGGSVGEISATIAGDFCDVVKSVNDKYTQNGGSITDVEVVDGKLRFNINADGDVNIRLLDDDYEVFSEKISVSETLSYSIALPNNGKNKRYMLVADDIACDIINVAGTEEERKIFYKDNTSGDIKYQFENSNENFTVEKSNGFGHSAPSRFIDINKRFIANLQGNYAKGYYVASADLYINECNSETDAENDIWSIKDTNGSKCGARFYVKNNILMLECENELGEATQMTVVPITMKQWYNLSVEISPDMGIDVYVDGKLKIDNAFLKSDCKNGFRLINIDTRNSKVSMYIDNILLYEDYLKECLGFYRDIISGDTVALPKSDSVYWTSGAWNVTASDGNVYHSSEDKKVKLSALSRNGSLCVYYVTVTASDTVDEIDLKSLIDFNPDKLALYTNEYQKIKWSLKEVGNEIVYTAYVEELDKSCEFRTSKSIVYNKKFKMTEDLLEFSAEINAENVGMLAMAYYDSDGNLIGFESGNKSQIPENAQYCEAFVWENISQAPLTENSRVYNLNPSDVYIVLGGNKEEVKVDNPKSKSYITDLDSDLWFDSYGIFANIDDNVGFIDTRDCDDVQKIYERIESENTNVKGVVYLENDNITENPFSAIEACRTFDKLHTLLGEFTVVAPTKTKVYSKYNQWIKAVSAMRTDFKVVDTSDLYQSDEFEYTSGSLKEIGKRIKNKFDEERTN